jgi:hypothetical protein
VACENYRLSYPAKVADIKNSAADIEISRGDLLSGEGLEEALNGTHSAYYLVHSMGGKSIFKNTEYAEKISRQQGIYCSGRRKGRSERVIYLGALGERGDNLQASEKPAEVATILSSENLLPRSFGPPSLSVQAAHPRCSDILSSGYR